MFSTMTTNVTKPVINSMKKNNYVNKVNIDMIAKVAHNIITV